MAVDNQELDRIRRRAYEIYEDAHTCAQAHFIYADGWSKKNGIMGITSIIFSAIAGSALLSRSPELELIAGLFALAVTIIVATSTLLNPGKLSQEHLHAGTSYIDLKDEIEIFHDVKSLMKDADNIQLFDELTGFSYKMKKLREKPLRISTTTGCL